MKRIALLAIVAGAAIAPATAGAATHGLSAGGIKACADASDLTPGTLTPVPLLGAYPGPPGPFGGPNSRIDYADGKNNGTDLILYCQRQLGSP